MKNILLIVLCFFLLFHLQSCSLLTQSSPLWLDSSYIDMTEYEDKIVLLLPINVNQKYNLDQQQTEIIQESIKSNIEKVFDINVTFSEESSELPYPFPIEYMGNQAEKYKAKALVSANIFSLSKNYDNPKLSKYLSIGLSLTFTDVENPYKFWTMSRTYRANKGFNLEKIDFNLVLYFDLIDARYSLKSGKSFFPFISDEVPKKQGPTITVSSLEFPLMNNTEKQNMDEFRTTQDSLVLQISAHDVDEISSVELVNSENNFSTSFNYSTVPTNSLKRNIEVPVEDGWNTITLKIANKSKLVSTRKIDIERFSQKTASLMAIFDSSTSNLPFFQAKHDHALVHKQAEKYNNVIYLADEFAVRKSILRNMEHLTNKAYTDQNFTPAFYFLGQIQQKGEAGNYYLMTYDSIPEYPSATAISLDTIFDYLGDNAFVMIETCNANQEKQGRFRLYDDKSKKTVVEVHSCERNDRSIGKRLLTGIERKTSVNYLINREIAGVESLPLYRR